MTSNKFLTIYCIYNANGSLSGEIAYLFKKYFYGLKCSMCEITHNFISEKEDWKDRLSQTKINLKTVHLDEQNMIYTNFLLEIHHVLLAKAKRVLNLFFQILI